MHAKNKFVCLVAMLLAAFALQASAATKSISLTVPASLTASASVQQIPVTINNTGNSNANSFEIDWSVSAAFAVQSCQVGSGTPVTPKAGLTGTGYKGCTFLSQVPNKSSVTVTLNVVITAACGAGSLTWNAFSWTGAPGPASQSFTIASLGTYTTPLPAATNCTLGFVTQPKDAFSGYTITGTPFNSTAANKVTVLAQQGNPPAPSPGALVAVNSGPCSISGSATTDANGYATFTTLTSTATATVQGCVLAATATGYAGDTSTAFNIVKPDGTLACDGGTASNNGNLDPLSNTFPPADGQTGFALVRGFNTPGDCGPNIPYAFTLDPGTRTTILTEDSLGQNPSVEYIVVWPAVTATSDPFAGKQPCVSWGVPNPQFPATPDQFGCGGDFIPGLACLTDDLDIGGGAMPTIPNVPPFDTASNPEPQYLANGQKAKVCIAQHGFSSGTGAAVGSLIYFTKIIDQSDTAIRLP